MEQRDEARVWLRFSHYRIWSWDLKGEAGGGNGLARSPQSGCVCVSLFLGTVRLCKCSVRRRARLSRLLTGRRVHNMSPHSGRQTASRNTDREQSGGEREREREIERDYGRILKAKTITIHLSKSSSSSLSPPGSIKVSEENPKEAFMRPAPITLSNFSSALYAHCYLTHMHTHIQ